MDAGVYLGVMEPMISTRENLWRPLHIPVISAPPLFNKKHLSTVCGCLLSPSKTNVFMLFTEESLATSLIEHMEIGRFDPANNLAKPYSPEVPCSTFVHILAKFYPLFAPVLVSGSTADAVLGIFAKNIYKFTFNNHQCDLQGLTGVLLLSVWVFWE